MKIPQSILALTIMSTSIIGSIAFLSRSSLSIANRSASPVAAGSSSIRTAASPRSLGIRMMSASPMEFAKSEIASNKVVVFSKSFCPFCKKTKSTLSDKGVDFKLYELNEMDDGADIQDALLEISGQKTVPNIFINGAHVGGNSELQEANSSGKLDELLAS
jgi:glutaredoxin 3